MEDRLRRVLRFRFFQLKLQRFILELFGFFKLQFFSNTRQLPGDFHFRRLSVTTTQRLRSLGFGPQDQTPADHYCRVCDQSYSYLYTIYADADRTSDSKVWDIYSDRDGTGLNRPYTYSFGTGTCGTYSKEGDCYNREHMIPQSKFNEASPMVSDAHHVLPTDGKVNGMRSSYPHGAVSSATWTSQNGSKLGSGTSASGYTGTVFEPINAYKGDTARIYFYFCVRYYNNSAIQAWESMNTGAKLKTGHRRSTASGLRLTVSAKEVARNNGVYLHQKNRNPFVDYPVLCNMIDFTN